MEYRTIYGSDIKVSKICLGTMTWGEQNTEEDAHRQLDYALSKGVNFIDTAEMYAVPPTAKTYGKTETYIGNWLKKSGKRHEIVLATKVAGPARDLNYIRGGSRLNAEHITKALEDSLRRLQTDYVDVYQTHWPERDVMKFGDVAYRSCPEPADGMIGDTLEVLGKLVKEGKIRHIGVSNESPWGLIEHLRLAKERDLPRIISIQNVYSLLNRTFEWGNAEVSEKEHVGLLAYSPLGFGVLSGKYLNGNRPEGSRLVLFSHYKRYISGPVLDAVFQYKKIAEKHGLNLVHMALAFVSDRPFTLSNIIGATTMEQLAENIASADVTLSPDVIQAINAVHANRHSPAP